MFVCTLFFMLLSGACGHSAARLLLLSTAFYAWGWICLSFQSVK